MKTAPAKPLPKDQLAEKGGSLRLVTFDDRIIVQPWDEKRLQAVSMGKMRIQLPDGVQTQEGMIADVIAVGPGKLRDSGLREPMPFAVGDAVFYAKYGGIDIEWDGKRLRAIVVDRVLARVITVEKAAIEAAISPEEREIRERMEAAIAEFRAFLEKKKGGA